MGVSAGISTGISQCPRLPGASASEREHLGGRVTGGSRLRSSQGTRERGLDVGRGWRAGTARRTGRRSQGTAQ
jgi:hypothetical protein